jgi:hypothetical protein
VPDAAVRYGAFELDELPRGRAARLELARFRFARQGVPAEDASACQALADEAGRPLLFGMAMDAAWRRLVAEALARAGLRPWSMNPNVCRQWNRFHERLARTSGALVALGADAWSVWLWDARGTPRFARARWRERPDDHGAVAAEVERAILAYSHGGPGREVRSLYTAANGETAAMAAALDARLARRCSPLETMHPALAAALEP